MISMPILRSCWRWDHEKIKDNDDDDIKPRKRWYKNLAYMNWAYVFVCTFTLTGCDESCLWIWLSIEGLIMYLYSCRCEVLF